MHHKQVGITVHMYMYIIKIGKMEKQQLYMYSYKKINITSKLLYARNEQTGTQNVILHKHVYT